MDIPYALERKQPEVDWGLVLIFLSPLSSSKIEIDTFKGSLTQLHSLLKPADVILQLLKHHSPLSSG